MSIEKGVKIGLYYAAGVVLVGSMAFSILFNLTTVQVPGLVTAPIGLVRANMDGIVSAVKIKPGDLVNQLDQAIDLASPEIERDYLASRHKLSLAQVERQQAMQRQAEGRKELDQHIQDLRNRSSMLEQNLQGLEGKSEQYVAYEAEVGELFKRKISTYGQMQRIIQDSAIAKERVVQLRSELLEVTSSLEWARQGYFFAAGKLDRGFLDAKKSSEMTDKVIQAEEENLRRIGELRSLLKLRIPEKGKVLKVFVNEGSGVENGQTVALIEEDGERVAEAFVDRKQMARIAANKPARVHIPGLGRSIEARIENIDYSPDPEQIKRIGTFGWAGGTDAVAVVQLALPDSEALESLTSGEPATIQFARRLKGF